MIDTTKADTVKAPLTHAEGPPSVGTDYRWSRAEIFASGALTLADLLDRVPGVTTFRSGWIASPQVAAFLGSAARVRVFLDGLELDALDPRTRGVLDLGEVPLWAMEEVAVERGADETRVYLRTWRVDRTTPSTRTDVVTGDQNINLYRAFFGRRFGHGEALQLAGQQYGTTSNSTFSGGDALALLGRVGLARGRWSIDAFATRTSRSRDPQQQFQSPVATFTTIPALKATRTDAYVRGGYGDPESGPWAQILAARLNFQESTAHSTGTPLDTVDTTVSHSEYVAAMGFTRWGVRLSATDRLHQYAGATHNALSGRASLERGVLALSLLAEQRSGDTTSSVEAAARLTPLPFLSLAGALTRRHGGPAGDNNPVNSARGEADVRLGRLWLGGGVMLRDGITVPGLAVYDPNYVAAHDDRATGAFLTARGRVWKDVGIDGYFVRWQNPGLYLPQSQSREEVYLQTNWLSRFPTGNFGFLLSIAHQYRQPTFFATSQLPGTNSPGVLLSSSGQVSHSLTAHLEIRILDAIVFGEQRYGIRPLARDEVPGFTFPVRINFYGVRWQFWN